MRPERVPEDVLLWDTEGEGVGVGGNEGRGEALGGAERLPEREARGLLEVMGVAEKSAVGEGALGVALSPPPRPPPLREGSPDAVAAPPGEGEGGAGEEVGAPLPEALPEADREAPPRKEGETRAVGVGASTLLDAPPAEPLGMAEGVESSSGDGVAPPRGEAVAPRVALPSLRVEEGGGEGVVTIEGALWEECAVAVGCAVSRDDADDDAVAPPPPVRDGAPVAAVLGEALPVDEGGAGVPLPTPPAVGEADAEGHGEGERVGAGEGEARLPVAVGCGEEEGGLEADAAGEKEGTVEGEGGGEGDGAGPVGEGSGHGDAEALPVVDGEGRGEALAEGVAEAAGEGVGGAEGSAVADRAALSLAPGVNEGGPVAGALPVPPARVGVPEALREGAPGEGEPRALPEALAGGENLLEREGEGVVEAEPPRPRGPLPPPPALRLALTQAVAAAVGGGVRVPLPERGGVRLPHAPPLRLPLPLVVELDDTQRLPEGAPLPRGEPVGAPRVALPPPPPAALPDGPLPLPLAAPDAEGEGDSDALEVVLTDAEDDGEPLAEPLPPALALALPESLPAPPDALAPVAVGSPLRVLGVELKIALGDDVEVLLALGRRVRAPVRVASGGDAVKERVTAGVAESCPVVQEIKRNRREI